jgi:hypothetical protein
MILPVFTERYADIAFMLSCQPFEAFTLFRDHEEQWNARRGDFLLHSAHIEKEVRLWKQRLDLETIDTLYVYGLGLGYYFQALKEWLDAEKERLVIFFEDDPAVFHALMQMPWAGELISHPQCHIHFIPEKKHWKASLSGLTLNLPTEQVEVTALQSYRSISPKKIQEMRLFIFRQATIVYSLSMEALFSHKLFENLYPNFKRLPEASYINLLEGQFKDIPAVICGAGPSLAASIPALKKLEQRALIMAGGSSIAALTNQSIFPHFSLAVDPNPEEYHRLKQASAFEVPLLYGNRVEPTIFHTCNGPSGYIRTQTGGRVEEWLEEKIGLTGEPIGPDLGLEAMSVTTLAIALAVRMGCNPIIFAGIDLAYTGMKRYASGVLEEDEIKASDIEKEKRASMRVIRRKDRNNNPVFTLVKWVMESSCISAYAKLYPKHQFINATDGGIGFQGIAYQSLEELLDTHCAKRLDLRGKIHAQLERSKLSAQAATDKVIPLFQEVHESLLRCQQIAQEMLTELERIKNAGKAAESGKQIILEIDFKEELAFDALLHSLGFAVDQMMHRRFLHTQEGDDAHLERSVAKWTRYKTAIDSYLLQV